MMKRFLCCLSLLAILSFSAHAAPVRIDGVVGVRNEYNNTNTALQIPQNESNNNLSFAYLHWACSPADYSVYLGLQYYCTDHAVEDGRSGVEVRINDVIVGTVYQDGTVDGVDRDRFELEGVFSIADGPPYEEACEIRVGIKFWPDGDIVAGVRILDFSGNPSNYYRQRVYSPYATTTQPTESTRKAAAEKSVPSASAAAETTARSARTTAPVITASPKRETTAASTAAQTQRAAEQITTSAGKPTKAKTTKPKTTKPKTTKRAETTEPSATEAFAAVLPATTETTASAKRSAAASNAQMYSELNKARIVGIVLVVMILTAAIMSSVFLGMRRTKEPDRANPERQEQEDTW